MKKFVVPAALGLVTLFVALPEPAAARSFGIGGIGRFGGIGRIGGIGRFGGWGLRGIGFRWAGYARPGWYGFHRSFRRALRADYYAPYVGAWYYYPTAAYYPNAGAAYYYPTATYYAPDQTDDGNAVTIRMTVPRGAKVWFDGAATSQTGVDRTFVSPSLIPGREYVYHLRVQWHENGKAVERNRKVAVHAGDQINLTINK
jgi:uncharacterized protein (TIGR03000 family)